jgi:hypothetical protein
MAMTKRPKPEIKTYKLDAAFVTLTDYDIAGKDEHFIEASLWYNGEGFDVNLSCYGEQRFSLTWGQYKALKDLIKKLDS